MNTRPDTLWQRLTRPSPRISDPETRRHSRLLNMMFVLLPVLIAALLLLSVVFYPLPGFRPPQQLVLLAILIAAVPVYILNHRGYYRLAVWLVVLLATGGIITAAVISGDFEFSLLNLVMPVLIASTFLSFRWALALAAVLALGLTMTPGVLGHFIAMTMLILFIHQGLLLLESWRQQQLVESEGRYRQLAELMSDFAYSVRVLPDGRSEVEWITGAFEQITGHASHEFTVEMWRQIIHPDDQPYMLEQHRALLRNGHPQEREFRIITADGGVRWLREFTRPQWSAQEERLTVIHGAIRDITTAKQAEDAERDQRVLAEALRDTAAALNSTLAFDEVLDRIIANIGRVARYDACTIMLIEEGVARTVRHRGFEEYDPNQVLSEHLFRVEEVRSLREMSATGQPVLVPNTYTYEGWVRMPISDWIVSFLGVPIKQDGVVIGFLNLDSRQPNGFTARDADNVSAFADQVSIALRNARVFEALSQEAMDLEQRVVAHTVDLEREKRQLRTLLDSMGEGVVYIENKIIRYANAAITTLTGYQPDELVGRSLDDFGISSDTLAGSTLYKAIFEAVQEVPVWRGEVGLRNRAGTEVDIGLTVSRISDPDDPALHAVALLRDVATEKALQAQRERFVSITSHELRTPITNILTRLYLLQRQPEKQTEHVAIIEAVTQRMKRLVEDLLDLPQFEQGLIGITPEPVVLQDLIAAVIQVQQVEAEKKDVNLKVEQPETPLRALVDEDRMIQVVTNLVVNAISYTPAGGCITVGLNRAGENILLRVVDTGPGIAPEHLDDIFKPFFRAPQQRKDTAGTGLGLSIAREIITLHGGTIEVSSDGVSGTCFSIRLRALD